MILFQPGIDILKSFVTWFFLGSPWIRSVVSRTDLVFLLLQRWKEMGKLMVTCTVGYWVMPDPLIMDVPNASY